MFYSQIIFSALIAIVFDQIYEDELFRMSTPMLHQISISFLFKRSFFGHLNSSFKFSDDNFDDN